MAHIRVIPMSESTPVLEDLYNKYKAPWGGVDHILKIHSMLPDTLEPHVSLYRSLMFSKGPLTRRTREMIATVVSKTNECDYCIHHHSDALYRVTRDKEFALLIRDNFEESLIDKKEKAILYYAIELTRSPGKDHEKNIQNLKALGLSDEEILHATLIVAYFNFVNRIALGLGVELESYWNEEGFSDSNKPMTHDN